MHILSNFFGAPCVGTINLWRKLLNTTYCQKGMNINIVSILTQFIVVNVHIACLPTNPPSLPLKASSISTLVPMLVMFSTLDGFMPIWLNFENHSQSKLLIQMCGWCSPNMFLASWLHLLQSRLGWHLLRLPYAWACTNKGLWIF